MNTTHAEYRITRTADARGRASAYLGGRPDRRSTVVERVALLVILALLVTGVWATSGRPAVPVHTGRVLTSTGDTLWTLASTHPVEGLTTQQNAELIASLNHIRNGSVPAGRAVLVPEAPHASNVAMR